jgi:predicted AlkP superfamily pyrophosphatase or phosphodiesterase
MGDYSHDGFSHFNKNGKLYKLKNRGTGHGTPWDYDTHIPIIMYGPGFINSKKEVNRFVTQQDITQTYSEILNTEPPVDADGTVLKEALNNTTKKPKAILTIVLDQVGMEFYNSHPDSYPNIKRMKQEGTFFNNAKVTHLESETAVGHVAIGTGAYPDKHGIPSNSFWIKGINKNNYSFGLDNIETPVWLKSPTFSDVYDLKTNNKAIIVSYCYAERAAMGMAGHGAMFNKGDKDIVFYYNEKTDLLTTNDDYFILPQYLRGLKAKPYLDSFTNNSSIWLDHFIPVKQEYKKPWSKKTKIDNKITVTPALPIFEGDIYTKIIENEPIGQDDITDLMYINFKSTDAASHSFGFESEESKQVLEAIDKQVGRVVKSLEDKVGKDNIIVTITADHGSTPLVELNGAERIISDDLQEELNKKFDTLNNDIDSVLDVGQVQITLDENELKRNGFTIQDVKNYLLNYKIKGKNFYKYIFTYDELMKEKYKN